MAPAFALALLLVALCGLAFHAIFGRALTDLPGWVFLALLGFTAGEAFARLTDSPLVIGEVHAVHGVLGAWAVMSVFRWRRRRRVA